MGESCAPHPFVGPLRVCMTDPVAFVRWGLYLSTGGAFGVGMFALLHPSAAVRLPWRKAAAALAAIALALSVAGLWLLAASMSGQPLAATGLADVEIVAGLPGVGVAWWARMASLAFLLGTLWLSSARTSGTRVLATSFAAVALGSLAWGGHAALGEGAAGLVHLVADVAHLLAAGAWLGAIAALLWLAAAVSPGDGPGVAAAHDALANFALTGTVLVATLVATGLVNSWFLVGPAGVASLTDGAYGRLLIVKLLLFGAMLALAATNRWRLTTALERDGQAALGAVRRSLALELAAGVAVFGVVAWLGLMSPPALG